MIIKRKREGVKRQMYVVCSKFDGSIDKAKKFCEDGFEVVFVEDILKNKAKNYLNENNSFYFLTLNKKAQTSRDKLLKSGAKVLNGGFNLDKFEIQSKLCQLGLPTPRLLDLNSINKGEFPLFVKGKTHSKFNALIQNKHSLEYLLKHINPKEFYLEERVKYISIEKIYFLNGKVFFKDDLDVLKISNIKPKVARLAKIIANGLNLDVFSMEIFVNGNKIWIFDIDDKTGLYLSKEARSELKNMRV